LRFRLFKAPLAINAPNLPKIELVNAARRYSIISFAVPSAVFSAILPLNPSVTMTSTSPSEMSSFHKTCIFHGEARISQDMCSAFHGVVALHVFRTDVEQADAWLVHIEDRARESSAHDREIDELLVAGIHVRAKIEHNALSFLGWPQGGDRRAFNAFDHA